MAPTEPLAELPGGLRAADLTPADIAAALGLSGEAGWNQTAADWQVFVEHGRVIGLFAPDGALVASAAILPYGDFAWISMVLVTASWRHRRLASRLVDACMRSLQRDGITAVLDATPAGAEVYRPLGFQAIFGLQRWEGQGGPHEPPGEPAAPVHRAADAALARIVASDAAVFGAARRFLIADFLARPGSAAFAAEAGGFVILRQGRRAAQLGPLAAPDEAVAGALLDAALDAAAGQVFLDVPDRWRGLATRLAARGFRPQRPYTRMALGRSDPFGDPAHLFILAGPEFG
jgi:GNAT superfamily N-acetyltransferase